MDLNVKLQILKSSPLFKNFPPNTLKAIIEKTQLVTYQEETLLYNEGEHGDCFYVIATGEVTLYKSVDNSEVPVYILGKGDYFGEMSYFNKSGVRTLSAKVHAKTVLFEIPHAFLVLIQQNSNITYNLIKAMNTRQNNVIAKLASASAQSTKKSTKKESSKTIHKNKNSSDDDNKIDESLLNSHIEQTLNPKNKVDEAVEQAEESSENLTVEDMLYNRKLTCPHCHKKFTTPRVLSKHIRIIKSDSDFFNYYEGVNPVFYEVAVCPKCCYAFTDDTMEKLGPTALKKIKEVLETVPKKNYNMIRTIDVALETFVLAILCQTSYLNKDSLVARLYLRLAWLYRYKENEEKEKVYLQVALEKYLEAFKKEKFEAKTELQLSYLVGELHNRLGDPKNAVHWFSRLVMHPQKNQYPAIVRKAREQWQDLRAKMKEEKA
ncbi:MAG: DUF2225 domain-containing protein [Firmicutes bacterium]|nr:DUF2225 domain-containing protein [Bacillota bacterium]